jgi:hypothetical protein
LFGGGDMSDCIELIIVLIALACAVFADVVTVLILLVQLGVIGKISGF